MLPDGSDLSEEAGKLRDLLRECRQRRALFENAADERLRVIEHGDRLLREQADTILKLQQEAEQYRGQLANLVREIELSAGSLAAERNRLDLACREASRGMEELANRERLLTREILELRNEGLLHSIIRRLRSIFS